MVICEWKRKRRLLEIKYIIGCLLLENGLCGKANGIFKNLGGFYDI